MFRKKRVRHGRKPRTKSEDELNKVKEFIKKEKKNNKFSTNRIENEKEKGIE